MTIVIAVLNALSAIPKICDYVSQFAAAVVLWYIGRQKQATLSMIADAAAFASRANTDEERYQAAAKWQAALSRDRVS